MSSTSSYNCKYCDNVYDTKQKLGGHTPWRTRNPKRTNNLLSLNQSREKRKSSLQSLSKNEVYGPVQQFLCEICGNYFRKMGLNSHVWRSHGEGINFKPTQGRSSWNKGLTTETSLAVKKGCETLIESYQTGKIIPAFLGKKLSPSHKQKIAESVNRKIAASEWHESFGRMKICVYANIRFHSTWEIKYAMFLDDKNILWRRPKETFPYVFENKARRYTPDFYLINEDVYVEIKGFETEADHAKWSSFPKNLIILRKDDLVQMGVLR